ncbi:hypothetical protein [Chitinophaga niabensis]|uniref:Bulb-type lectin domain-containing protein n=1 Tax=Chitinophaga niabensis TaxID=536979 RepID=A0A1N6D174_9BACT|nr:hypothetical protein [Chitinophaga niabensis]SIN64446.1 hypothetical protein SAMN04488055_0064 [Chitinophaga niabensis]
MKFLTALSCGLLLLSLPAAAQQLKLGDNPSVVKKDAVLELNSTNQGLLLPRVLKSQILSGGKLFNADNGMLVYVTDAGEQIMYNKRNGVWEKVGDYTNNIWNANKIQNRNIANTAPATGDVLKWNGVTNLWEPTMDNGLGVTYATLPDNNAYNADTPDDDARMKIWASPGTGTVLSGPLGTDAYSWNVLAFRGAGYTTQLYFDKSTLAVKEWVGNNAPVTHKDGNIWYKVVTMNGDLNFVQGGLLFAEKSFDSNTEVKQQADKLFWDNPNDRLGVGTNAPTSTLHAGGSFATNVTVLTPGNVTLNETHNVVVFRRASGSGNMTVTLPLASTCIGREYTIVREYTGGSGNVVVAIGSGDALRGSPITYNANAVLKVQSIGTRWIILVNSTTAL